MRNPVAVADPGVAKDPVVAEEPVVAEATTADAEAMDRPIAPGIANSMPNPTSTAGHVVLMSPKSMIAIPVATNYKDTKIQQPELIQREAPYKIKSSLNGNDAVGSYKQIILKRKRLTQQQK
jgi:hypothetical protein